MALFVVPRIPRSLGHHGLARLSLQIPDLRIDSSRRALTLTKLVSSGSDEGLGYLNGLYAFIERNLAISSGDGDKDDARRHLKLLTRFPPLLELLIRILYFYNATLHIIELPPSVLEVIQKLALCSFLD